MPKQILRAPRVRAIALRAALAGLCLAVAAAPAVAQRQSCAQPAEQLALAVQALKSQMMVIAITCNQANDYNQFVTRFQRDLQGHGRNLIAHFRRVYGNQGQRELDAYVTNLANAQSQEGIRQGSLFCSNQASLVQQLGALTNAADLPRISQERQIPQIYSAPTCQGAPPRSQGR